VTFPNNPAQRLALIMAELRQQEPTQQVNVSFAKVLGIPTDQPVEFFRALGQLYALPAEVEAAAREHADPQHFDLNLYLFWVAPITNALRQGNSLHGRTSQILNEYTDEHVRSLSHCSGLLSMAGVEGRLDPGEVTELFKQIDSLYGDVLETDAIPADLKSWILKQLDLVRQALRELRIRGPQAAADAFEQFIGSAIAHNELLADANEESQSFLQRLGEIFGVAEKFGNAAKAIGTGTSTLIAAGAIIAALVSGSPIPSPPGGTTPAITQAPSHSNSDSTTPR
jgi:hypothetical protein